MTSKLWTEFPRNTNEFTMKDWESFFKLTYIDRLKVLLNGDTDPNDNSLVCEVTLTNDDKIGLLVNGYEIILLNDSEWFWEATDGG